MEKGSRVPYGKMWFSNEDLGAISSFQRGYILRVSDISNQKRFDCSLLKGPICGAAVANI